MTDYKTLLKLAREGSSEAVYALYTNSFRHVYSVVHRICGSELISRRLAGETYAGSFRNLDKLTDPANYPVWMDRLATYVAQSYVARVAPGTVFEETAPDFSNDEKDISIDVMNTVWDDVNLLLSGRTPDYRAAGTGNHAAGAAAAAGLDDYDWQDDEDVWKLLADVGTRKILRRDFLRYALIFGATALLVIFLLLINGGRPSDRAFEFPNVYENMTDERIAEFANALSGKLSGQIGEIYKLNDDTYYVVIYLNGEATGGALVSYGEEGQAQLISESSEVLSSDELGEVASDPYLDVSFRGNAVSDTLHNAAASASETDARATADGFAIDDEVVAKSMEKAREEKEKLSSVFRLTDDETDFSLMLRIMCRNIDLSKQMNISLDSSIAEMIGSAGEIEILLGDEQHTIKLSREQLAKLCGAYGSFAVHMQAVASKTYEIGFSGADGARIDELFGDMTFTLPADSRRTYVFASYPRGSENRGGVYDEDRGTISFPVYLSGRYELIGNEVEISDMQGRSREEIDAASFMVSMGFMSADYGGAFDPDGRLSRSDFLLMLGRMFLATDDSLSAGLSDVDSGSPEYAYILAGLQGSIIGGYGDGSFGGENAITRQEMISMCARTMHYKLGTEYPQNTALQLIFTDVQSISEYAKPEVALAVSEKLIDRGGALRPGDAALRREAALILYRMYRKVYGYND